MFLSSLLGLGFCAQDNMPPEQRRQMEINAQTRRVVGGQLRQPNTMSTAHVMPGAGDFIRQSLRGGTVPLHTNKRPRK